MKEKPVNVQSYELLEDDEELLDELTLTIIDVDCGVTKLFKVTNAIEHLIKGKPIAIPEKPGKLTITHPSQWEQIADKFTEPKKIKAIYYQTVHQKEKGGCGRRFAVEIRRKVKKKNKETH